MCGVGRKRRAGVRVSVSVSACAALNADERRSMSKKTRTRAGGPLLALNLPRLARSCGSLLQELNG